MTALNLLIDIRNKKEEEDLGHQSMDQELAMIIVILQGKIRQLQLMKEILIYKRISRCTKNLFKT
jgi:hypothetical protein